MAGNGPSTGSFINPVQPGGGGGKRPRKLGGGGFVKPKAVKPPKVGGVR